MWKLPWNTTAFEANPFNCETRPVQVSLFYFGVAFFAVYLPLCFLLGPARTWSRRHLRTVALMILVVNWDAWKGFFNQYVTHCKEVMHKLAAQPSELHFAIFFTFWMIHSLISELCGTDCEDDQEEEDNDPIEPQRDQENHQEEEEEEENDPNEPENGQEENDQHGNGQDEEENDQDGDGQDEEENDQDGNGQDEEENDQDGDTNVSTRVQTRSNHHRHNKPNQPKTVSTQTLPPNNNKIRKYFVRYNLGTPFELQPQDVAEISKQCKVVLNQRCAYPRGFWSTKKFLEEVKAYKAANKATGVQAKRYVARMALLNKC